MNTPPFNEEEREFISSVSTNLSTIVTDMNAKLIMGLDSFDNYDSYVQKLLDAGAEQFEQIYNDAQERISR